MPWANHDMPSIQVGALQAYLRAVGIEAEGAHWFVEVAHAIGLEGYRRLWDPILEDGEALYAYLLFPEMRRRILRDPRLRRKQKRLAALDERPQLRFSLSERFFRRFERLHQAIFDRYDWSAIDLVGLTLNFGQTVASLYAAREIKKRNPRCKIIVGGAEASGRLGESLLRHFSQLDYACNGEGEKPLRALALALRDGASDEAVAALPGLVTRGADGRVRVNPPDQVRTLRELPDPAYDDYFEAIATLGYESPHAVCRKAPIEASRGCYYACTFCALNLQWTGIRTQTPERVAAATRAIVDRHRVLTLQFVDNVNPANAEAIFDRVAADGRDLRFFFELRTDIPKAVLASMQHAGLDLAQMGVEALSTNLLRTFNKRTKVIHNLQGMKNCAELGIRLTANLIVDHPGSTEEDVAETHRVMKIARGYPPPDMISHFALEVGAPDFETSARGTVSIRGNHARYRRIYPRPLFAALDLPRKAFETIGRKADWSSVVAAREEWAKHHEKLTRQLGPGVPHLAYYDGARFLRIEDHRSGELEVYVFEGIERDVYLAIDQVTPWSTLRARLPHVPEERLRRELAEMEVAGLVFEEDDSFLALAIAGSRVERKVAMPGALAAEA